MIFQRIITEIHSEISLSFVWFSKMIPWPKTFFLNSAWSLCECYGSLAVYATSWGCFQESRRSLLLVTQPWRWSDVSQLPRQKCCGYGSNAGAPGEIDLYVFISWSQYCLLQFRVSHFWLDFRCFVYVLDVGVLSNLDTVLPFLYMY